LKLPGLRLGLPGNVTSFVLRPLTPPTSGACGALSGHQGKVFGEGESGGLGDEITPLALVKYIFIY